MRGATSRPGGRDYVIKISIHAPREGSDRPNRPRSGQISAFQSTLPVRGATRNPGAFFVPERFQSTLPVRGATEQAVIYCHYTQISIHAPREGSDHHSIKPKQKGQAFQSTLPVRGTTAVITIIQFSGLFQSTLPVRGATICPPGLPGAVRFQSTLPVRGATYDRPFWLTDEQISIHAPREGSDFWARRWTPFFRPFQSTLPVRGATFGVWPSSPAGPYFNPRSP